MIVIITIILLWWLLFVKSGLFPYSHSTFFISIIIFKWLQLDSNPEPLSL